VVRLPQLKLGYAVTFSLPEFKLKKYISWVFHIHDRSESSSTYDMIIGLGRDLLGELGIIINFNDHTVTWDTDSLHYSNERQRYMHSIISRGPD
jgi:hypothetical protein